MTNKSYQFVEAFKIAVLISEQFNHCDHQEIQNCVEDQKENILAVVHPVEEIAALGVGALDSLIHGKARSVNDHASEEIRREQFEEVAEADTRVPGGVEQSHNENANY